MSLRVALITGCSSGVGAALAALMASKGYAVYATMRTTTKTKELGEKCAALGVSTDHFDATGAAAEGQVRVRALDVVSDESVKSCVSSLMGEAGRVDVVVNNAGYTEAGTLEALSIDQAKAQFETNVFGVMRVLKQTLPIMREQQAGRMLVVSSLGGINGVPFNDVYCSSKFAVEGAILSMAPTYLPFNVHCSLVEPGAIRTAFVQNAAIGKLTVEENSHETLKKMAEYEAKYSAAMGAAFKEDGPGQSAEEVASFIVDTVLAAEKPNVRYQTNSHPMYKAAVSATLVDPTGNNIRDMFSKRFFSE